MIRAGEGSRWREAGCRGWGASAGGCRAYLGSFWCERVVLPGMLPLWVEQGKPGDESREAIPFA